MDLMKRYWKCFSYSSSLDLLKIIEAKIWLPFLKMNITDFWIRSWNMCRTKDYNSHKNKAYNSHKNKEENWLIPLMTLLRGMSKIQNNLLQSKNLQTLLSYLSQRVNLINKCWRSSLKQSRQLINRVNGFLKTCLKLCCWNPKKPLLSMK